MLQETVDDLFNFHPHLSVWKTGMTQPNDSGSPARMTAAESAMGNADCLTVQAPGFPAAGPPQSICIHKGSARPVQALHSEP